MGFHLPSAIIGSAFACCTFLLIERELSHRHRLSNKWPLQEYIEDQWKGWRKNALDSISDSSQQNIFSMKPSMDSIPTTAEITSKWNKTIATLRNLASGKD